MMSTGLDKHQPESGLVKLVETKSFRSGGVLNTVCGETLSRSKGRLSMAKLIYSAITSLDGYVADADGNFDWAAPDEEVHAFVNDLERPIGTYLYGRRMYEVMVGWETMPTLADQPPVDAGLRGDLAGGRQDRLLHDAGGGLQRQDADRASLRPGGGPADEGDGGT